MGNQKNTGGNIMSFTKRASRRLSLLAGSSVVAAGLCAGSVMLTPTAALAANECPPPADPLLNGGAPDSFTCAAGDYPTGITYSSAGDLTVTTTGTIAVDAEGVDLTGNGADSVTWNSVAGNVVGTTGDILQISTQTGDITALVDQVDAGFSAAITHGILASSAGGDISITANRVLAPLGTGVSASTTGAGAVEVASGTTLGRLYGIYASTETGSIEVTGSGSASQEGGTGVQLLSDGGDINFTGRAEGNAYGLRAITSGSGSINIAQSGFSIALTGASGGQAAVDIQADAGAVNFTGNAFVSGFQTGSVIRTNTGGETTLNTNFIRGGVAADYAIDIGMLGGSTTINHSGQLVAQGFATNWRALRAQGTGDFILNNSGQIDGSFDLSGLNGAVDIELDEGAVWRTSTPSHFGPGDSALINNGLLMTTVVSTQPFPDQINAIDPAVTWDFGAGTDLLANTGVLSVGQSTGRDSRTMEGTLRLVGLEAFQASGLMLLGADGSASDPSLTSTDGWYDDVLIMSGGTFTGLPGSRIIFDVNFGASQAACDIALRNDDSESEDYGDMPAADCVRLEGVTTAGNTAVTVNDLFPGNRGINLPDGIVLVDVPGGTSSADHFTLDPNSGGYSTAYGGSIDKGFFAYKLVYDEAAQQHKLVSFAGQNAQIFPILAQASQTLWRTSTGSWLDRQADLRGGADAGVGGGVWLRAAGEQVERDTVQSVTLVGEPLEFASSIRQDSYAITGGIDLISTSDAERAFVVGAMAGYANADVSFDTNDNSAALNGWTGGAYASFLQGGLFVDAAVNAGKSILEVDVPGLNLNEGELLDSEVLSVGAQLEAGWRFPVLDAAFIEPLASAAYVRTSADLLEIRGADAQAAKIGLEFDDPTSLRAALGARMGLNHSYGPIRAQISGLVRLWNEFEDETRVRILNEGPTTFVTDDFSGQFTEFGVGTSLWALDGAVSGFFNFGGKFGDDYESQNLSAGVRVNW